MNLVDATVLKIKEKKMVLVVTATTDLITSWLVCLESGKDILLLSIVLFFEIHSSNAYEFLDSCFNKNITACK